VATRAAIAANAYNARSIALGSITTDILNTVATNRSIKDKSYQQALLLSFASWAR